MCLRDPVVQQLYDGELDWCDIPEDDTPFELDNWREYISKPKISSPAWKKNTRNHLFPLPSRSIDIQTDSIQMTDSQTQTEIDELPLCLSIFIHSILNYTPAVEITHQLIEERNVSIPQITPTPTTSPVLVPAPSPIVSKTLFLKNLPSDLTELQLKEIFKGYGAIREISIKRMMDPKNATKVLMCKFAHIRFQTVEGARKAYEKEYQHLQINKKKIGIEFAKEDR
jgi:hypothetical protein